MVNINILACDRKVIMSDCRTMLKSLARERVVDFGGSQSGHFYFALTKLILINSFLP